MVLKEFERIVKRDVRQAYTVLRLMPKDGPKDRLSYWPYVEYMRFGSFKRVTPKQISHMDRVLDDLLILNQEERVVVCGRALGFRWKMLEEKLGSSHTTLRKFHKNGLLKLYNHGGMWQSPL